MLIDTGCHSLQLQRKISLLEQPNPPQAPVIRSRNHRQSFVCLPRAAIQSNFDGEGRPLHQIVGDLFINEGAVGEQGNQESFFLGVGVDIEKIFAGENFAAGVEQPESAHLDQFVEHLEMFFRGHFAAAGFLVAHGEIVVAVLAFERAAAGDFDGNLHGHSLAQLLLVQVCAECSVTQLFHGPPV